MSPKYKIRMLPTLSSISGPIAKTPRDHQVLSLYHAGLCSPISLVYQRMWKTSQCRHKAGEIITPLQGSLLTFLSPPEGLPWPREQEQPQWVLPGDEGHSARGTPFLGPGALWGLQGSSSCLCSTNLSSTDTNPSQNALGASDSNLPIT